MVKTLAWALEGWFKSTPRLPSCDIESDHPGFSCFLWPEFKKKNFQEASVSQPRFAMEIPLFLATRRASCKAYRKLQTLYFYLKKNQFSYLSFFRYNRTFKVGISEQRSRWNMGCWSVVMVTIISLSSSVPRPRLEGGGH